MKQSRTQIPDTTVNIKISLQTARKYAATVCTRARVVQERARKTEDKWIYYGIKFNVHVPRFSPSSVQWIYRAIKLNWYWREERFRAQIFIKQRWEISLFPLQCCTCTTTPANLTPTPILNALSCLCRDKMSHFEESITIQMKVGL